MMTSKENRGQSRAHKNFFWEKGKSIFFQPKLTNNQPNDIYEQEAVAMADKVMRMTDNESRNQPFFKSLVSSVQRKCDHCDEEERQMQRKKSITKATITPSTESYVNSLSGGRSLNENERSFFEPRMDYDFRNVRLHTDSAADQSAKNVNALAFTQGNHIVFRAGQYQPETDTSKKLLAHELTHVIQQTSGSSLITSPTVSAIKPPWKIIQRDDSNDTSQSSDVDEVCEDLRSALANSIQVIELYHEFIEGNIQWEDMRSQTRMVGNAAQGVVGAGLDLPPIVQEAIAEVEGFGFEEVKHMGRLALGLLGSDEFFHSQWVRNEIERQNHYNLVLIRFMYENGCPDFPGQWSDFQQQILPIGTRGSEQRSSIETTPRETRTAIAWVALGDEHILVLATEVENSGQLRFERWIDSDFRELALGRAASIQGSIPSVPGSAVRGLPSSVPGSAARR